MMFREDQHINNVAHTLVQVHGIDRDNIFNIHEAYLSLSLPEHNVIMGAEVFLQDLLTKLRTPGTPNEKVSVLEESIREFSENCTVAFGPNIDSKILNLINAGSEIYISAINHIVDSYPEDFENKARPVFK